MRLSKLGLLTRTCCRVLHSGVPRVFLIVCVIHMCCSSILRRQNNSREPVGRGPSIKADWVPPEACADAAASPCLPTPFRSADGSCNNPLHPFKWGVALRPFRRILPPDYADGKIQTSILGTGTRYSEFRHGFFQFPMANTETVAKLGNLYLSLLYEFSVYNYPLLFGSTEQSFLKQNTGCSCFFQV